MRAAAIAPARPAGASVARFPADDSLPHVTGGSALASSCFEACSAFTRVAARMVAKPPQGRPVASKCFRPCRHLHDPLRLLPAGATVAGRDSHPLRDGAFPRHTVTLNDSSELVEHRGHVLPLESGRFGQGVQDLGLGHGLLERRSLAVCGCRHPVCLPPLLAAIVETISEGSGLAVKKRIAPDEPTALVAVNRDVQNGSRLRPRPRGDGRSSRPQGHDGNAPLHRNGAAELLPVEAAVITGWNRASDNAIEPHIQDHGRALVRPTDACSQHVGVAVAPLFQ